MENSELYNKLVQKYGISNDKMQSGVYLHENGVIELRFPATGDVRCGCVYIPKNYNSSNIDSMISYINNGSGGKDNIDTLINNTDGNFNYIVSYTGHRCDDDETMINAIKVANEDLGINIENITTSSHSAACGQSFKNMEKCLENTNVTGKLNLILTDVAGSTNPTSVLENCAKVSERGSNVIFVLNDAGGWGVETYPLAKELSKEEYNANVYIIKSEEPSTGNFATDHHNHFESALNNQIAQYIIGATDSIYDVNNNCNYKYYKYNPKTYEMEEITFEEFSSAVVSNEFNIDKYTTSSSYEVKNTSIVASNFYNQLSSIGNLSSSKSIISSDSTYVIDAMNSIRSQIKATASNCSTATTVAGRFSSGILASIGSYVNKFYNVYGNLLSSLEAETKSIVSLSEAIDDMNLDLQNGASAIGTFSESANPYLKVEDTLVTEETSTPTTSSAKKSSGGGGGSSSSSSTDTTQQETTVTTPVAETPVTTTESSSAEDTGIVTTEEPVSEEVEVADDIDMDIEEDSTDTYIPTDTTTSSTVTSSKKKGNTLRTVGIVGAVAAGAGAAAYGAKEFIDRKNSNSDFEDSSDNDDIDDDDDEI